MKQHAKLEKQLQKWKAAYKKQVSISHSRF